MVHASTRAVRLAVRWITGQEAVVLLAALAIVLSLTVFAKTAAEMREGGLREFDDGVLRMVRSPDDPSVPIGPTWLVQAAIDVTALGGTTVLALFLMIVVGYLALESRYDAIVLVVIATAGGGLLGEASTWACTIRLTCWPAGPRAWRGRSCAGSARAICSIAGA